MITISPALIIATWTRLEGLTIDPSTMPAANPNQQWPSFVSRTPDEPQQLVTVYGTSGIVQGKLHKLGLSVVKYGIQIRTRTLNYEPCYEKLSQIVLALDAIHQKVIPVNNKQVRIHAVTLVGDINDLGDDEQERQNMTANFLATLSLVL